MIKEAIILAGGFGTRLQSVISDVPKPMAPVSNEPFLNYLLSYLSHYGITKAVLSTGYLEEKIREYYQKKNNTWKNITLSYSHEKKPLGTGGAIRQAMEQCEGEYVLAVNGDSFFDVNLNDLYSKHSSHHAQHTLALRHVSNASRYGAVETKECRIVSFKEKEDTQKPGTINGGIYILKKEDFIKATETGINFSIERDFFEKQLAQQHIYGFEYTGQFIDIGTPEDFIRAQDEFKYFTYR
ncbi:MAG: nucleotidyltransferase family protein [Bacteroidota bacterium]|nr:nucleotidyltransferase family protein [Bacteroidota bacterium]